MMMMLSTKRAIGRKNWPASKITIARCRSAIHPCPMRFSTWNATLLAAGGNGKLVKSIAARGRTPYYTSRCWRGLVSCSAVQEEVVAARGSRPTAWGVWRRCSGTYRRRRGARGRCSPSTEKLHLRYGDERSFCPAGIWRNDHASAPPSQEPPSSSMPERCSTKCTQA